MINRKLIKQLLFLFLTTVFHFNGVGQNDLGAVKSLKWKTYNTCYNTTCSNPTEQYFFNYIGEDTTINGKVYFKVLAKYLNNNLSCCDLDIDYGYLRNDTINNKVYIWDLVNSKDTLIYDFELGLGDSLVSYLSEQNVLVVTNIDTIVLFNRSRRRWFFNGTNGQTNHWFVIEGIGGSGGLIHKIDWNPPFQYNKLLCITDTLSSEIFANTHHHPGYPPYISDTLCQENYPNLIMESKASVKSILVYPNPAYNKITIKNIDTLEDKIELINLLGEHFFIKNENGELDIQHLPSSVYLIKEYNLKFIKF